MKSTGSKIVKAMITDHRGTANIILIERKPRKLRLPHAVSARAFPTQCRSASASTRTFRNTVIVLRTRLRI